MKLKKVLLIAGIVALALMLTAVLLGVLNALVADGKWNFGWTDYRYDDTDFEAGEGSVIADAVTEIDVDWIDGAVQIILCKDSYISLSESADETLSEDSLLRYCVSRDGTSLSVKYRASSWYFGNSKNKDKTLILRIPEHMIESGQLRKLTIRSVSANVCVDGTPIASTVGKNDETAFRFSLETLSVETKTGDVCLILPYDASFRLRFDSERDQVPTLDFSCTKKDGQYICGTGGMRIGVISASGKLTVTHY